MRDRRRAGERGEGATLSVVTDPREASIGEIVRVSASDGFDDFARFDTASADILARGAAALHDADLLQVRVEAALGGHHRVAARLTVGRPAAA